MLLISNTVDFYSCEPEIRNAFIEMAKTYDVTIVSGKRSQAYNDLVGGSPKSLHLLGKAIDFRIKDVNLAKWGWLVFQYLPNVKGIGFDTYKGTMHVDIRDSEDIVMWNYDREGKAI